MTATLRAPARRTGSTSTRTTTRRAPLAVVRPDARTAGRSHRFRLVVVVGVVLVGGAVFLQSQLAQQQVQLRELSVRTRAAQARYQGERLAYAEATAPAQIIERATRLGLVPAGTPRYVSVPGVLPPSDTAGAATSSTLGEGWEKVKPHLAARP
jgi:uncharacterized protein HemX